MSNDVVEISDTKLLAPNPLASVVMITYNHEKYLGQAIEGVVSQITDFPFELIVGEDCSTDSTRQIALNYQKKFPHIIRVLYSEKNVGVNRNYARTLFASRGAYIASCEGDDYWTDVSKLQKQVDFLSSNSEFVAAYHDSIMIDQEGTIVQKSALGGKKVDYSARDLLTTKLLPTQTLCHKNVIKEFPPEFYYVLAADAFITSMLGAHGGAKYMHDIKQSVYRQHGGGIWSGSSQNKRFLDMIVTSYWLAVYHERAANHALSISFARMIVERALNQFNVDIFSLLKSLMFVYMQKPYNFLRAITSRPRT